MPGTRADSAKAMQLVARDRHARRLGGRLVLAYRAQARAEPRPADEDASAVASAARTSIDQ